MENRKEYTFTKPAQLDFEDDLSLSSLRKYLKGANGQDIPNAMVFRDKNPTPAIELLIAEALGLDALGAERIGMHSDRWYQGLNLTLLVYFAVYTSTLIVAVAIFYPFLTAQLIPGLPALVLLAIFAILVASLGQRLSQIVVQRRFAESNSVWDILHLLADLSREDVLIRPDRKRMIILRMNWLAKYTLMIGSLYSSRSPHNAAWLKRHFGEMAHYIEARACWAAVPTETTLVELRNDFYNLAPIYINGNYGSFVWKDTGPEQAEEIPISWQRRVLQSLPRFFGISLPLILLGAYLLSPNSFPLLNLDKSVVSLVFFGWLLVALDTSLNLGIVSGVTKLAKEIKDLG